MALTRPPCHAADVINILEFLQAAPRLYVPQSHGIVRGAREGAISLRAERVFMDVGLGVDLDGLFCTPPNYGPRLRWRTASPKELRILQIAVRRLPVDVQKL